MSILYISFHFLYIQNTNNYKLSKLLYYYLNQRNLLYNYKNYQFLYSYQNIRYIYQNFLHKFYTNTHIFHTQLIHLIKNILVCNHKYYQYHFQKYHSRLNNEKKIQNKSNISYHRVNIQDYYHHHKNYLYINNHCQYLLQNDCKFHKNLLILNKYHTYNYIQYK